MKSNKLLAKSITLGLILAMPYGVVSADEITYDNGWYKQEFSGVSGNDLVFTNSSVSLDSSKIDGANSITFNGALSFYGTGAEIKNTGKLVTGGKLTNSAAISVSTLGDEEHRSEVFNGSGATITVDNAVIGVLTNNGTFTVNNNLDIITASANGITNNGTLTVTGNIEVDAGMRGIQNSGTISADQINLQDSLENKSGATITVNEITAGYLMNEGSIESENSKGVLGKLTVNEIDNKATLNVADFNVAESVINSGTLTVDKIGTETDDVYSVSNKANAQLSVKGNVYAGLANSGTIEITGDFKGSGYFYNGSSFTAQNADVRNYTQIDNGSTFEVENLNINTADKETGIFVDTENFTVNDTVDVNGYLYFRENSGDIKLNNVNLNNEIQVSGDSLTVNNMTVKDGSLVTCDLNDGNDNKEISIDNLTVQKDGNLFITNDAGEDSSFNAESIVLEDNATLENSNRQTSDGDWTSAFGDFTVKTLTGNNSSIINEGKMDIGKLNGTDNNIEVHSLDKAQITIGTNNSTGLQVTGTSDATSQFNRNDLAGSLQDLADTVSIGSGNQLDSVLAQESDIIGETTALVDEYGNIIANTVIEKGHIANEGITELANVAFMAWRAENDEMHQRMGELRSSNGEAGIWARMKRGESKYGDMDIKNQYSTYQLGYDEKVGDSNWYIGGAISRTEGKSSFATGSGENQSTGFTVYGTYVADDGQYVDLSAKYARLDNEFDVFGRSGIESTGDYRNNGYAFSAEYGKRIEAGNDFWVEPQVQLTYGHLSSANYTTSRDVRVTQDAMDSVVGRLGFAAGKDIGAGNVYVKASYLYDFDGDTNVKMTDGQNSAVYDQDLGGGWFEVGIGTNINLSETSHLYFDVEKTYGGDIETPWQWNAGVRFDF